MDESILESVKKSLGLDKEYTPFDPDIIMYINSVFMSLRQFGIGADKGFSISGPDETWTMFLGEYEQDFEAVKTYVYLKVRLIFDPPTSAYVLDSYDRMIQELEWRLILHNEDVVDNE